MAKKKAEAAVQLGLRGEPEKTTIKTKDVTRFKELQRRKNADKMDAERGTDGTFILERAEKFAAAMKAGAKFPPIKLMRIVARDEADKSASVGKVVVWDGNTTHRAAEMAHVKELDCLVWEGTAADALAAASEVANTEHEDNGLPRTNADKEECVRGYGEAWAKSGIPKDQWPSNREAAEKLGVSRGLVNTMDPFGRAGGDKRKEINEKKKAPKSPPKTGPAPGGPVHTPIVVLVDPVTGNPATHAVTDAGGKVLATYEATSPADALKRYADENEKAEEDYTVQAILQAPPAGSAGPTGGAFDWAKADDCLGWLARATPVMADVYGRKKDAAFKEAERHFEMFCRYMQDTKAAVSKKGGKRK